MTAATVSSADDRTAARVVASLRIVSTAADRSRAALELAVEAIDAVRREDATAIQSVIDRADVPALVITLAGMLDDDRSIRSLMRDVPRYLVALRRTSGADPLRPLAECGSHAAFNRHVSRGEEPCEPCWEQERAYQRSRSRSRRAAAREARDADRGTGTAS